MLEVVNLHAGYGEADPGSGTRNERAPAGQEHRILTNILDSMGLSVRLRQEICGHAELVPAASGRP